MAKRARKPSVADAALELIRAWGRQGGKKGGKLRWQGVSKAERSAAARKAAEARWKRNERAD